MFFSRMDVGFGDEADWNLLAMRSAMSSWFSAMMSAMAIAGAMAIVIVMGAGPGTTASAEPASGVSLDLNRATAEQLADLPGIGAAKAAAIVAYRKESGAFRTLADLEKVRGIGPVLADKLGPHVRLGSAKSSPAASQSRPQAKPQTKQPEKLRKDGASPSAPGGAARP